MAGQKFESYKNFKALTDANFKQKKNKGKVKVCVEELNMCVHIMCLDRAKFVMSCWS